MSGIYIDYEELVRAAGGPDRVEAFSAAELQRALDEHARTRARGCITVARDLAERVGREPRMRRLVWRDKRWRRVCELMDRAREVMDAIDADAKAAEAAEAKAAEPAP